MINQKALESFKFHRGTPLKFKGIGTNIKELNITQAQLDDPKYYQVFNFADVPSTIGEKDTNKLSDSVNYYRYIGPSPQRDFCKQLIKASSGRVLTMDDIVNLNSSNKGFGIGGSDTYSIFKYRGGVNCKHTWVKYTYDTKKGELVESFIQPAQNPVGYVTK